MKKTFIENGSYSHKNRAAKKENTAHRKQDKQFISKSVASGMRPKSCDPHRKAAFMPSRKIKRNSCCPFVHEMEILTGMHSLRCRLLELPAEFTFTQQLAGIHTQHVITTYLYI